MLTSNIQKFSVNLDKLNNNSFFRVNVLGDTEILEEDVKLIAEKCKVLGEGKILPVLIIIDKYTLPSAEARKYIAQVDSNPYAKAEAYVISDLPQKIVGNFFLKFDKPARPTKIFTKEEDALEWLEQFF